MSASDSLMTQILRMPRTRLGWWSIGLAVAFLVLFPVWLLYVMLVRIDRPTFFSDPVQAALILVAAAAGSAGGITGALSLAWKRERSLAVFVATALGPLVLWWTIMEVAFQP